MTTLDHSVKQLQDTLAELRRDAARVERAIQALTGEPEAEAKQPGTDPVVTGPQPGQAHPEAEVAPVGPVSPPTPPPVRHRSDGAMGVLRAMFLDNTGRVYDADQALSEVLERGWSTDSSSPRNVIGSSLAKLVRRGDIEKVRPGQYRMPPPAADAEVVPAESNPTGAGDDVESHGHESIFE